MPPDTNSRSNGYYGTRLNEFVRATHTAIIYLNANRYDLARLHKPFPPIYTLFAKDEYLNFAKVHL